MVEETKKNDKMDSKARGFRRTMTGKVIKDKMDKSVVVECVKHERNPLYGKYIKKRKRYHVHDADNRYHVGDEVEIQEHSPISKTKRFVITRLIKEVIKG